MVCSEVKPLVCRVPLPEFSCHALAFYASSTCISSRYNLAGSNRFPFHGLKELAEPPCGGLPVFRLFLLITSLHSLATVKRDLSRSTYPQASGIGFVLPRLPTGHWNINQFPFCIRVIGWMLRIGLLLADERCQETRVLCGVQDSRLDLLLLTPGYAFLMGPSDLKTRLLPQQNALLPDEQRSCSSKVSAPDLAPYIFGARTLDWSAITRCLKDGCF